MRFEQLKYLSTVVHCRSINKAAELLFVTQPAISSAIKQLEEELHVELLKRTSNGVVPTLYGKRMVADAEKILGIVTGWKTFSQNQAARKEIQVDYTGPASDLPLFNLFFRIREIYPNIDMRLNYYNKPILEMDSDASIIHACSTNRIDTVFNSNGNSYRTWLLYEDKYKLFISTSNPLARKKEIRIEDLSNHVVATRSRPHTFPYHTILTQAFSEVIYLGGEGIVFKATEMDYAVALLPGIHEMNKLLFESGKICAREIADINFPFYHYLLSPLNRVLSEEEHLVQTLLIHEYKELIGAPLAINL